MMDNIVQLDKIHQNDLVGFDFFVFDNEHDGIDPAVSNICSGVRYSRLALSSLSEAMKCRGYRLASLRLSIIASRAASLGP